MVNRGSFTVFRPVVGAFVAGAAGAVTFFYNKNIQNTQMNATNGQPNVSPNGEEANSQNRCRYPNIAL